MLLIQKGLPIYCASRARVYININSHRAPVFFGRRHLVTAPPELRHRFTAIDRLAVTERGKVQSPCDLMPRAERRVRPNIQQMRPKTRGDVGLRVAARRLTRRFLGSHTERKQMQLSRADQRVSAAGYELDNGH